ncbi:MAG TPA: YHYH protein [Verrucomicrobiae bacterium]|nr:YHYH protein [Verrucomicrobiae bacterium]
MKTITAPGIVGLTHVLLAASALANDPRTNSWLTTYASRYARIYTNNAMKNSGTALTTWSNGSQNQSAPAYAGVQAVYSSSNWVYLKTSGLAQHVMGPWQNGAFPNLPKNQNVLYRIPRHPVIHTATNLTGLGAIGYFVDGVAMFDSRDGFVWTGSAESGMGTGYWNREAYVNEGATFDPGYAHQEQTGTHHYHANPVALRYLLGDHVDFNAATRTYSESTNAVTKHSPILGWVRDGWPMYGPYGYSSAPNAASGIRRMISGYVLRNGQSGTDNLTNTLRSTLPAWAKRFYNADQAGPSALATYPVSRYMEDYAYLGDLTNSATGTNYQPGADFDLDEYNGRWCVTPEFPNGTYAYFISISSNGTPVFPNNIGRAFYGNPTGSATTLAEAVVTNFLGGANLREVLNTPAKSGDTVVLTWSAVEGGTYRVESSSDLTTWATNATGIAAVLNTGDNTNTSTENAKFFRVNRTGLAAYDGMPGGSGASFVAPGGSVSLGGGTNITISITLPANPPNPPANAPITSVTLAGVTATGVLYAVQGTVIASFALPAGTPTSATPQTISVQFQNGPPQPYLVTFTILP